MINKTYVINLKKRPDRWNNINKSFEDTGLKLIRWDAVYGKDLPDDEIKRLTTGFCYQFCAPSLIGVWLSHYRLWQHIVKNREDRVLILEDDTYPVKQFGEKLCRYFEGVPKNWDMVYLGCFGSCDPSNISQIFSSMLSDKKNRVVHRFKDSDDTIVEPALPLGFHAYMLSYRGAKKLVENRSLDKVIFHIDLHVGKNIVGKKDFKAYAILPPLIYQKINANYSDNQHSIHPLINRLAENVKVSKQHTLDSIINYQILTIRKLDLNFTLLNVFIFILSYIVSLSNNNTLIYIYLGFLFLLYLVEGYMSKFNRGLAVELIIIMLIFTTLKS